MECLALQDSLVSFLILKWKEVEAFICSGFAHCCSNNEPAGCAFDFLGTF